MGGVGLGEARGDGLLEEGKVVVVGGIQAGFFDELPKAFDQIEVWRIRGEKQQLDAKRPSQIQDHAALLITRIVEDERNRNGQSQSHDPTQQLANAVSVDVSVVRNHDKFMRQGVQCAQHVEALPPCGGANKQTRKAPQNPQIRRQNKMRGVYKKDRAVSRFRFCKARFQLFF